ncbi:hypothetical protein FOA52_010460 [Chlamydomonas sp. UWO 241]|nr:hypothetical protein FOA52_010460 [Chlamydomonas sp. UWO 241]
MVLAGLRYHSCGQRRLAMTAYRQVLRVYAGKGWRAILEHLHDVLGKHLREAGDEAGALDSAAQLLTCMGRSAPTQQHYLDHFLGLATRAQHSGSSVSQPGTSAGTSAGAAPSLSPPLPLPHVDARDVRVRFDGSSCSGGGGGGGGVCGGGAGPLPDRGAASGGSSGVGASPPQARQLGLQQHHQRDVSDEVWASMEGAVSNDGAGGGGGNWLDGGGGGSGGARGGGAMRDGEQYNTVVAGELVNVSVRFRNPLAVALSLAHVRLVVDFENDGSGGETAVATSSGTAGQQPAALTASAPAAAVSAAAAAAGVSVRAAPPAPATCGAAPPGGLGDSGDSGNLDPLSARPRAPRGPPTSAHVSLSHAAFTLHPGEAHTQELTVTVAAGASGWLRVAGCAWVLGGVAHGSVSFEPMGRRRKAPAGERPGQRKDIAPHRRLLFSAIGAAPRLELSVEGLPQRMAPSASPSTAFSTAGAAAAAAAAAAAVGSAWAPGGGGGQQPGQQHPAAGAASGASGAAVGAGAGTRGPLLLAGELVMATCVLRNAGSAPATALALALRGGPAALPASDAALESSLRSGSSSSSSLMDVLAGRGGAGAVAVQAASASAAAARHAAGGGDASTATQVHRAWPGVVLLPGEELRWPLLLHASVPGPSLELQMVWYCEPQVPDKAMKARLLRCALSLPVAPLLTLSAHLSRSSADLRVRGLSLRVDADAGAPGAVELAQLACWGGGGGGGWRMCSATGEGTAAEAAAAGALRLPHGSAPPLQPGETAALELRLVPPSVHPAAAAGGPAASAAMPNYAPPSLPPLPPAAPPAPPGHSLDLDLLSSPGPLLHALLTQGAGSVGWSGPHTARQKAPGGAAGAGAAALALPPRADLPVDVLMAWRLPGGSGGGASVGVSRLRDATRAAARPLVHPLRLQLSGGRGTTTTAAFCGATPAGGVATAPGAAAPQHTTGPRGGVAPGAAPGATTAQPGSGTMTLIVARHSFATAGSACVVPLSLSVVNLAGVDAGSVGVQAGAAWGSGEERGPAWSCSAPAAAAAAAAGSGAGAAPTPGSYHGAPQGAPGQAQAQQQVQQQAHQPRATVSLGGGGGPMGAHAPPAPAPPAAAAGLPAMPEYSWVGQTRAQLGALAAGQAARVELAVLVLRPGTFVVRGVHAVCTYGAGQKVVADAGELLLRVEDAS